LEVGLNSDAIADAQDSHSKVRRKKEEGMNTITIRYQIKHSLQILSVSLYQHKHV
jgi:hypothetical protein